MNVSKWGCTLKQELIRKVEAWTLRHQMHVDRIEEALATLAFLRTMHSRYKN